MISPTVMGLFCKRLQFCTKSIQVDRQFDRQKPLVIRPLQLFKTQSLQSLGWVIGPLVGGFVYTTWGSFQAYASASFILDPSLLPIIHSVFSSPNHFFLSEEASHESQFAQKTGAFLQITGRKSLFSARIGFGSLFI
jgi:hypothetical protein